MFFIIVDYLIPGHVPRLVSRPVPDIIVRTGPPSPTLSPTSLPASCPTTSLVNRLVPVPSLSHTSSLASSAAHPPYRPISCTVYMYSRLGSSFSSPSIVSILTLLVGSSSASSLVLSPTSSLVCSSTSVCSLKSSLVCPPSSSLVLSHISSLVSSPASSHVLSLHLVYGLVPASSVVLSTISSLVYSPTSSLVLSPVSTVAYSEINHWPLPVLWLLLRRPPIECCLQQRARYDILLTLLRSRHKHQTNSLRLIRCVKTQPCSFLLVLDLLLSFPVVSNEQRGGEGPL